MFARYLGRVKQGQDKLADWFISIQDRTFVQIIQKTIYSLFPFILLGSIVQIVSISIFSDFGFFGRIFSASSWIPYYSVVEIFFSNLTLFTLGLVGVLMTYYSAYYTAEAYGKNKGLAGLVAIITYFILASQNLLSNRIGEGFTINLNALGSASLIWGLLIGYCVGLLFKFFDNQLQVLEGDKKGSGKDILSIIIPLTLSIFISSFLLLANRYSVFTYLSNLTDSFIPDSNNLLTTLLNAFLTTMSAWIGLTEPFVQRNFTEDLFSSENLSYVITNHSTENLPYLFTDTTLYHSFGKVAGVGGVLALAIALILYSKERRKRQIGALTFLPIFFNNGTSLMVGLPILLNPIYLIPFVLCPLLNMLLASLALYFQIINPTVYPVPAGTPETLFAFIGAGGDIKVLIFSLVCLCLDICIYLPFINLDQKIQESILERRGS